MGIEKASLKLEKELFKLNSFDNFILVAITGRNENKDKIVVFLRKDLDFVPSSFEGYPVKVIILGS